MEKYKILVSYSTGNSFGSQDTEDYLDLEWDNLEVAKENLKAIKSHYDMYNKIENPDWKERKKPKGDLLNKYSKEWWFPEYKDEYLAHNSMKLKTDTGKLMQQWNFWCGHFEYLYGAEIVSKESDMKFEV